MRQLENCVIYFFLAPLQHTILKKNPSFFQIWPAKSFYVACESFQDE